MCEHVHLVDTVACSSVASVHTARVQQRQSDAWIGSKELAQLRVADAEQQAGTITAQGVPARAAGRVSSSAHARLQRRRTSQRVWPAHRKTAHCLLLRAPPRAPFHALWCERAAPSSRQRRGRGQVRACAGRPGEVAHRAGLLLCRGNRVRAGPGKIGEGRASAVLHQSVASRRTSNVHALLERHLLLRR